jgi:hypothetical protein
MEDVLDVYQRPCNGRMNNICVVLFEFGIAGLMFTPFFRGEFYVLFGSCQEEQSVHVIRSGDREGSGLQRYVMPQCSPRHCEE